MASTQVTLKLEPEELQTICDALRLYIADMGALGRDGEALRVEVPIYGGDPMACVSAAKMLLAALGLRSPVSERDPQLRLWQGPEPRREE